MKLGEAKLIDEASRKQNKPKEKENEPDEEENKPDDEEKENQPDEEENHRCLSQSVFNNTSILLLGISLRRGFVRRGFLPRRLPRD